MKRLVFFVSFSIGTVLLGSGFVSADNGILYTSRPGLKLSVTALIMLLLVAFVSWLLLRSVDSRQRRRIPLFILAVMAVAALGIIVGLLAAMTFIIAVESLIAVSIQSWVRILLTFLIGSIIVFIGIRYAANRIIKDSDIRINRIAVILSLFTNVMTFILIFEIVNRIIR